MKKKRLMPMCLCLVLALGLAACDEIEDLLPSSGDDETSEVSPTEPGDTGDDTEPTNPEGPSESVPTYSIKITDPSGDISLEVGDSKDIEVLLVTTVDNTDSGVAGTASEVTLSSSDPSVVSVEGLTITALDVGEAVITATWTEHNVTSSDLHVTVTEPVVAPTPDVITYKVVITSPESGDEIEIDTETEVSVNLITITNGEEGAPVAATSSDVTIKESGSSSILTINDSNLSITGTSTGTTSIIATWTEHDVPSEEVSITIIDSTQGGGSENPGGDTEPSEPVISYGIEITSPSEGASIEVDEPLTISVALITYSDNTETSRDTTTTTGVKLGQSSTDGGEVDISGLTITGKTAGTVTITATWTDHSVTSEGVIVTVTAKQEEEHTYEYTLSINNKETITSLTYGETATVGVSLTTITDGDSANPSTIDGTFDTVKLETSEASVLSVSETDLSVSVVGYGTATLTATWIEHTDAKDSVSLTVEEPAFESFTFVITISYNGTPLVYPSDTVNLYAAGNFYEHYDESLGYDVWDDPIQLTRNNDSGYTYSLTLDFIPTVGTSFEIIVYDSSTEYDSAMWNHIVGEYTITSDDITGSYGALTSAVTVTTEYESWDDVFKAPETRENVKVTWYFVNSAADPTEYYSIPDYADAYVCGYFVGTEWTGYSIGGNTKLVSDSSNGYTVTFDEINVGEVTYNMYFEFNGNAQNHSAATSASWDANHAIESDTTNNTTMTIPATGDATVYIELNPAEIITDDANFCEVTLALKGSSGSSATSTIYYAGSNNSWAVVSLTKTTNNNSYDYYVTFNVDKESEITCGIYSNSSWGDSLQVSGSDPSGITNSGNNIVIPSSLTNYDSTLIIFTCNLSSFTGSGSSHVTASSVSVSH